MSEQALNTGHVPGQTVLPGMAGEVGYEAITLAPKDEKFCWEYVLRADNAKRAFMASRPNVSERTAEVESSKLLRKPEIIKRIGHLREELRRRLSSTVLTYHRRVMEVERDDFLDEEGNCKPISEMSDDARAILEFEQVHYKGNVRTVLRVPTRHQSSVELARIMGMHKDKMELTGKDGNPIETESVVKIYIPSNGRD